MPAALQIQAIAMLCQCDTQALLGVDVRSDFALRTAVTRVKPDHATFSMLLHSTTADSDGRLLDRLPGVLDAMNSQMQRPNANVRLRPKS